MDSLRTILPDKEQLKSTFGLLPLVTVIADVNLDTWYVNDAWLSYTGKQLGDTAWQVSIHPEDLQGFLAKIKAGANQNQALKAECRVKQADGEYRLFAWQANPHYSETTQLAGYILSAIEIHDIVISADDHFARAGLLEREQALNEELAATNEEMSAANEELIATNEELQRAQNELSKFNSDLEGLVAKRTQSLLENEHRTRSMIENAPFPIGVYVGREMRIEFANKAITDVWGKGEDVIGKLYSDILPELHNQAIFQQLDDVFTTGVPFKAENQRVDIVVNGVLSSFYFNYNFNALRDQAGKIYGVMNTAANITELVKAKLKADQSEQELYNVILQAPVAMCLLYGPDHVVTVANDLMISLWGKPVQQVMHRPIFEGLPDAKGQGLEKLIHDVYTTGIPFRTTEHPVSLLRNGITEDVYQNFVYQPYYDHEGTVVGVIATTIDVTDHVMSRKLLEKSYEDQQEVGEELAASNEELAAVNEELTTINEDLTEAQEQLFRSEKLFKSIALNIPDSLILVIDTDQRFIAIEGDLMGKLGYAGTDYIGKRPQDVVSPERYEASRMLYERVLAGEKFSEERKSASGEDFIVHLVPLKDEADVVYAGLLIALDITKIKNAELHSAKLAAIVHSSNDAIVSKTLDGMITSWNKSAERIFGYAEDEMLGESILKLIPADRLEEEPTIIGRIRKGERVEHFETRRLKKDGSIIDVSLSISPVTDPQGNVIGVSKIARDISEKKLEETRKNDFIGMVSHELKTPLTSLSALVQVLNMKLKGSDDSFVTSATTKANIQVKKMTNMINGFLNVARLESGQLSIERQPFELRSLIDEVLSETRLVVPGHHFEFKPGPDLDIQADYDKISSVVSNLVGNAIKYSNRGTTVTVACSDLGSEVEVSVHDQGIGISHEDIDRLFDRYYRVQTNSTKHISGFGIGLYLSSEVIKRHDGKIWAESESGEGSVFKFRLPKN